MRVLIVGAGGHAQVIADALFAAQRQGCDPTPIGYVDDNPALLGSYRLGLPILGLIRQLDQIPHDAIVIGIGNNQIRRMLFEKLHAQGECFATVRHPSAILGAEVQIGAGSVIFANVVVNVGSRIGSNVILNTACTVDHHNQIADHAHLAPGSHLGGDVQVGAETLIGIGATVMPQRSIGTKSIVGAGAVVVHDIGNEMRVVGIPAKAL